MRLIDADELKTAFPCSEYVRTECVRSTIDHMATIVPSAQPDNTCNGCRYERFGNRVCDQCSRFYMDRYEVKQDG